MRGAILLLVAGCGQSVTWPDLGTSSPVDLSQPDVTSADLAEEPYFPDLADVDLEDRDLLIALTADLRGPRPDLRMPDLAPCGDPNQACCNGATCDSQAAMALGWVDAYCAPSGLCEMCGRPGEPCCAGMGCVMHPQLKAYCANTAAGFVCIECPGGACP